MSLNDMLAPTGPSTAASGPPGKKPYKSFRKKYRKLKLRFDRVLAESNSLLRAEDRATALARRLQEANDQILEILLDLNDSPHIPDQLRFDLGAAPPSVSAVPSLEPDEPWRERTKQQLSDAQQDLHDGVITQDHYAAIERELLAHLKLPGNGTPRTLESLEAVPHTPNPPPGPVPDSLKGDLYDAHPASYLSPPHEDEYLAHLDAQSADPTHPPDSLLTSVRQQPAITDKDVADRNPVSVINWLRRNANALVTEKEKEPDAASEKAAPAAASASKPPRGGKKTNLVEDDEPYRPKGGSGKKRKRETDGETKGPRKKASKVMREGRETPV